MQNMNETYLIMAKTVEEAIAIANREYAKDGKEVSYEILEMPKKGFLGIGARLRTQFHRCRSARHEGSHQPRRQRRRRQAEEAAEPAGSEEAGSARTGTEAGSETRGKVHSAGSAF